MPVDSISMGCYFYTSRCLQKRDITHKNEVSHTTEMVEGAPATKIAAKAKELGMKQAKVSRETGIRKTTVSHHFNGRCKPQIGNLVKYARVFGCSVDELVD